MRFQWIPPDYWAFEGLTMVPYTSSDRVQQLHLVYGFDVVGLTMSLSDLFCASILEL